MTSMYYIYARIMTEVNVSTTVGMFATVGEMSATVGEMSVTVVECPQQCMGEMSATVEKLNMV